MDYTGFQVLSTSVYIKHDMDIKNSFTLGYWEYKHSWQVDKICLQYSQLDDCVEWNDNRNNSWCMWLAT